MMSLPIKYIFKKLLSLFITLFCIVTATFFLMHLLPGDPLTQEKTLPPEILEQLRRYYGLDLPLYKQYFRYLYSVLNWDFGISMQYKDLHVNTFITSKFPISALLGIQTLFLSVPSGICLGVISSIKQHRYPDYLVMGFAILGLAAPNFILGALLQYVFALKLHLLPVASWGTIAHTILPTLSLSAFPIAFIARLTRANMLDVLSQDYIKTAKAKGLPTSKIIFSHALKNALLPVITYLGPLTVTILVGSFVIEKIYGIPGLGLTFVNSVINRDYPVIMGITIFYGILLTCSVQFIEFIYPLFDPRISLKK